MCNFIIRYQGTKPGVIVLGTHYETNYPLRNINFVGANDGASTTGLLMAIADRLRAETANGKKLEGYSVWLVFFDGEEAIQEWSQTDSTYGSRHLAAKWGRDGTLGQIKAFMLADMIGDKDLDIQRETNSTGWLVSLVAEAAKKFGYQRYFFQKDMAVEDDHLPFVERGVPSIDVIDLDYGPNNSYHHTAQDTMDKISAHSLTIDGDVFQGRDQSDEGDCVRAFRTQRQQFLRILVQRIPRKQQRKLVGLPTVDQFAVWAVRMRRATCGDEHIAVEHGTKGRRTTGHVKVSRSTTANGQKAWHDPPPQRVKPRLRGVLPRRPPRLRTSPAASAIVPSQTGR